MKQITVISTVPHTDLVTQVSEAMATASVNIETLDSYALESLSVTVLTVDHYDDALKSLARAGLHAISEDALLVHLDDRPGALAALTRRFHDAQIPLHSVRFVRRADGKAIVAVGADRTREALQIVQDILIS